MAVELRVEADDANQRADRFARKAFSQVPLTRIFSWFRKKKVRCNGKRIHGNVKVEEGDVLTFYISESPDQSELKDHPALYSPEKVKVLAKLGDLWVLNKEAGTPSQPGSGQRKGHSLVERLWFTAGIGSQSATGFKPALAHRLDKETSGLVLAATGAESLRQINALIREHQLDKRYLCLVKNAPEKEQGTLRFRVERTDAPTGAKMHVKESEFQSGEETKQEAKHNPSQNAGQEAVTHYEILESFAGASLLEIRLETGRMHQIRAHFSHIGCPLAGDGRYGDFSWNRELKKILGLNRLFLHAWLLQWDWNGQYQEQRCPLPAELLAVIEKLRAIRDPQ